MIIHMLELNLLFNSLIRPLIYTHVTHTKYIRYNLYKVIERRNNSKIALIRTHIQFNLILRCQKL